MINSFIELIVRPVIKCMCLTIINLIILILLFIGIIQYFHYYISNEEYKIVTITRISTR